MRGIHFSPSRTKFKCISRCFHGFINIRRISFLNISNYLLCRWINSRESFSRFRFMPFIVYKNLKRKIKIQFFPLPRKAIFLNKKKYRVEKYLTFNIIQKKLTFIIIIIEKSRFLFTKERKISRN